MWNSAVCDKFNFHFSVLFFFFFACIDKNYISKRRLGTRLLFHKVLRSSWHFLIPRILMRQLVFTNIITNNNIPFHFWRKKNLIKHQEVSKYYDHDCLYFLLHFMSLLTAPNLKKGYILTWEQFFFIKNHPILRVFQYQIWTSGNSGKVGIKQDKY